MAKPGGTSQKGRGPGTRLVHAGRDPARQHGFVNTPIYRGSTVIFPTMEAYQARAQEYVYGRRGTPTLRALEEAIAELEGGARTVLAPSGLAAIATALFACVRAGDHILVADTVYRPTRNLCDGMLARFGVETTYYDPALGVGIADLFTPRTRAVFAESPGSQTFEMQDLPALAEAAHARGAMLLADNTWASPLYCQPLALGADLSIQAATKYVVGHADAMLGAVTANARMAEALAAAHGDMGLCAGPEDVYLGLRGLRTLQVRLERHWRSGLEIARWLKARPEVARVFHPALEDDPGHGVWRRDFSGASGLFSAELAPVPDRAVGAMLDGFSLFGMGASWGGYESLCLPFDARPYRTATQWNPAGPTLRFHIGLEDVDDLKADLEEGLARLASAAEVA